MTTYDNKPTDALGFGKHVSKTLFLRKKKRPEAFRTGSYLRGPGENQQSGNKAR